MNAEKEMKPVETVNVPSLYEKIRLSDFATGKFQTIPSKNGIKKAIKKGLLKIDGNKGNTADYLMGGEVLELFQETSITNKPSIDLNFDVLYEDDYLAIINKPAGITVSGNKYRTLENALPEKLKQSEQNDVLTRPEPIHRLDHPTSGALLIGKTRSAVRQLNSLFAERKVGKKYIAVTIGKMEPTGRCSNPIDGKESLSEFTVLDTVASERFGFLNLVELIPHTGRRHQLRIHMAESGNPILGDKAYGKEGLILKGKGLYLHSCELNFIHPIKKETITIVSPLPQKFQKLFKEIGF